MKSLTVLDAIGWTANAWNNLNAVTITKCFHHAGFTLEITTDPQNAEEPTTNETTDFGLSLLPDHLQAELASPSFFVDFDNVHEVHDHETSTPLEIFQVIGDLVNTELF